jgi:FlaG/FlaF family flagellin (archaellin)
MNNQLSTPIPPLPTRQSVLQRLPRWLAFSALAVSAPLVHAQVATVATNGSATFPTPNGTSATMPGNVSAQGGSAVTERGMVFAPTSLNNNPLIGGLNVTQVASGSGTGTYTAAVTGLTGSTGYTWKAYATNSSGTAYSSTATFTTPGSSPPTLASNTPTSASVTATTATLGGNVSSFNSNTNGALRAVAYSITSVNATPTPTSPNTMFSSVNGSTTGAFTRSITGLSHGTQYSFIAYATNGAGTTTTNVGTFTTLPIAPTVTSSTSASITTTTATLGGNVTDDGRGAISERGVVYSVTATNSNPLINGAGVTKATAAGTTGVFTVPVSSLAVGTTYSFKAYAINSAGTTYTSPTSTFTTLALSPTITSPTSASLTTHATTTVSSATLGGNVTFAGAEASTRGVVYSLETVNTNPVISGTGVTSSSVITDTAATTGTFTVSVTGLEPFKTYRYKAYITNAAGTVYTAVSSFTTPAVAPPINSSPSLASITSTGATLGGTVTNTGGRPITERGVVYSKTATNGNPLLLGTGVSKSVMSPANATGAFTIAVTGLDPNTSYSYKAFSSNAVGTNYTSVGTFTTSAAAPTIATPTKTSITSTTATLGGHVTKNGGVSLTERGLVYSVTSTNGNPLINGAGVTKLVVSGTSTGVFTGSVTGLTANTAYSFKAYATNSAGTSYTTVATFTTLAAAPSIATPTSASITGTAVTLGGNVTADNGATLSEKGVVYSISSVNGSPSIAGVGVTKVVVSGASTGVFTTTTQITGLTPGTRYSFKAYATNSKGTTYTSAATFTTSAAAPTMSSPSKSSITAKGATLGGTVSKTNGASITERGIVYSKTSENSNPLIDGANVTKSVVTGTTGSFTKSVGGLTANTAYSFKAYATNSAGTSYTSVATFTTAAAAPTMASTPTSSSISSTGATLSGNVTSDNGAAITQRGVVYALTSLNPNPKIATKSVTKATTSGTTGAFNVSVTGLSPGKAYSFRAYAINSKGTSYSSVGTFTATSAGPTVNSPTKTLITTTKATLGGKVVSANGSAVTERGVVYSVTASNNDPLISGSGVTKKVKAGTTGTFTVEVTGLQPGTQYSFKAYATNANGTSYTSVATFTTASAAPLAGAGALPSSPRAEAYETVDPVSGLKYLTLVVDTSEGASPVVEVSSDLIEWFSGVDHTTVLSEEAGMLKVRDNTPITPDAKRYIRVKP